MTHSLRFFSQLIIVATIVFTALVGKSQGVPELVYYKFDSPGTTVVNDASSPIGTNPAPLVGTTLSIGGTGQFNSALTGTGVASEYINTGWNTSLTTGDWTLSFWINNLTSGTTLWYLFGDGGNSFRCFVNGAPGAGNLRLTGTGFTAIDVTGVTGASYVLHFVRDATAGTVSVYKNGVFVNSVAATITMAAGTGLRVGSYATSTGLNGQMDEFRLYNRALTAGEITNTWNSTLPAGPCTAPPIAGSSVASNSTPCFGQNINMGLTGNSFGSGQTYQWESATTLSGPWSPEGSAQSSSSISVTPIVGANFYRCGVTCGASTAYSDTSTVTVPTPFAGGTYTINSAVVTGSGNFQSFTDAISAIGCGISGPVVLNVVPGSGPYNEQISIPATLGSNSTNTLTINGNGATLTQTLTGTPVNYATLNIDGADYITVDNLNIEALGATYGFGVHLMNFADHNTFTNCAISAHPTAAVTTSMAVSMSSSTISYSSAGDNGSNNLFDSCTFSGGYASLMFYGATAAGNANNNVTNCLMSEYYVYGIYCLQQQGGLISNNICERPTRTNVSTGYGIMLTTGCNSMLIEKNIVRNLFGGMPVGTTAYPLYCLADGAVGSENKFFNNLVYNIQGNGTIGGMYLTGADYIQVYNNTIVLDNANATAGTTYGIYSSGTVGGIDIQNNNVYITRGGTGTKHCLYFTGAGAKNTNFNNLYINSPAGSNHIGYIGSNQTTLANWQAATGAGSPYDLNSQNTDPIFAGATIGDFQPTSALLDNLGTPVPGVTTDILDVVRDLSTPDIGAYEFSVPACAGTPNNGTVVAPASVCAGTNITLVGTGLTIGTGITYDWQYDTGSGWVSTGGNTPSYTLVGGITVPTQFRVVTFCTNSSMTGTSSAVSVGINVWYNCYCTPISGCTNEGIENVTFGSINNNSNRCTNPTGYEDFSGLGSMTMVAQGQQLPISVTAWINSNPAGAGVWIDYDHNNVFDTTEFTLVGTTNSFAGTASAFVFSAPVTIDINAMTGITRMRVRSANSTTATQISKYTACLNSNAFGEYEDYLITINAALTCAGTPNHATATATATTICPSTSFNINAAGASTGLGLNYEWQYDDGSGFAPLIDPVTTLPVNTISYTVAAGILAPTQYRFVSTCTSVGGGTDISDTVSVGISPFMSCYCIPTGGAIATYGINSFSTTGGWTNISNLNTGTSPTGYTDYSSSMSVSASIGTIIGVSGTGVSTSTYGWAVWVDWNQNGSFADAGETMYNTTAYTNTIPANTTFTVPAGALPGNTKMRVIAHFLNNTPPNDYCTTANTGWAEWEDYTMSIVAPPSCTPSSALNATNVTANSADLGWTSTSPATQWEIEYVQTSGSFAMGTGSRVVVGGLPYNLGSLTSSVPYTYYVRDICGAGDTSSWAGPYTFYTFPSIPANDDCLSPVDISNGALYYGSNAGGTQTMTPCDAPSTVTATDVWYTFTTGATGGTMSDTVNTTSTGADVVVQMFSGSCGSFTPMIPTAGTTYNATTGCVDGPAAGVEWSTYTVTANTTYFVRVYSFGATTPGVFSIRIAGAPLAIKLDKITAKNMGSKNMVEWNTLSEERGDHFQLERSRDGKNFEAIYEVPAAGKTSGYTYVDYAPVGGVNYYRLKLNDLKGHSGYSKIVTAIVNNSFSVEVFPNPVSQLLTVRINGVQGNDAAVQISDVTGKVIKNMKMANNVEIIDMSGFTNGIYLIKYSDVSHIQTVRVTKH